MRRAIRQGTWLLGMCSLLVLSLPVPSVAQTGFSNGQIPPCVAVAKTSVATAAKGVPVQVRTDARTNAAFFFSLTRDGGVRMTAKAAELEVDKVVSRDGSSRIVLKAGDDLVSVAVSVGVVDVARGNGHRVRLDVLRAGDDEWLQTKELLAGSKALRLFRTLAYNLDPRTLQTPAGAAIALSDAVLGHLDGDVAAVGRFVAQMRAARQARIRPVRFGEDESNKCWDNYVQDTMQAANDYDACRTMYYWWDPRQGACVFVWTIQVESAWAVFLSCSSVPILKVE